MDRDRDRERDPDRDSHLAAAALLSVVAVSIAGALVGVRGEIDNANVALVFMTIVVLAAIVGGRLAGGTVSVVAALSFNFFHTQPYESLRIRPPGPRSRGDSLPL